MEPDRAEAGPVALTGAERSRRYRERHRPLAIVPAVVVPDEAPGRNERAVERTIAALRADDRLAEVDAATIALARTTARSLDAATGPSAIAALGRVHAVALAALLAGPDRSADADLDAFLAAIRGG